MMNLPTKTRDSKNSTAILNNNPLRLGEMELTNMGLVGSLDPVSRLLDMYANNEEARKELIKHQLLDDPFHINTDFEITTTDSNDKILKSYLNCLGVQIKANEDASEFDFIKSLPTEELDELVSLGKSDPDFNVLEYFKNKE